MGLKLPDDDKARSARTIHRRLKDRGFEAVFIGGCVRDMIRGEKPNDFDIATSARPEDIAGIFGSVKFVGRAFGVSLVTIKGRTLEVATFRKDGPYGDGRRPDYVSFATMDEDLERRDFTVNAMAWDPDSGGLIDRFGGEGDLKAGIIRAVGDPYRRFEEDRLRLIRCVRFAHKLKFKIEERTRAALIERAHKIEGVADERKREELTKILTTSPPGDGVRLLDETTLLEYLFPDVVRMKGVPQPENFHPEGDVYEHTILTLNALDEEKLSERLAWAALLHDVGKPGTIRFAERIRFDHHSEVGARMAREILSSYRFSRKEIETISLMIEEHLKFKDISKMRPGRLKRWAAQDHFSDLLELHRADCLASHGELDAFETGRNAEREIDAEKRLPPRLVTGNTLIGAGLTPGPAFGEILDWAYEEQLSGTFSTEEDGLREAGRRFPRHFSRGGPGR